MADDTLPELRLPEGVELYRIYRAHGREVPFRVEVFDDATLLEDHDPSRPVETRSVLIAPKLPWPWGWSVEERIFVTWVGFLPSNWPTGRTITTRDVL